MGIVIQLQLISYYPKSWNHRKSKKETHYSVFDAEDINNSFIMCSKNILNLIYQNYNIRIWKQIDRSLYLKYTVCIDNTDRDTVHF